MDKDLVFLGIQGCGKGTQADVLLKDLPNHMYFEMGETLRGLMSNSNLIGNYIRNLVDNGFMVDNFITHDLIDTSLQICVNNKKNILIDGFPRLAEQAEFFMQKMESLGRDYIVIHFELSQKKAIKRMMHRAQLEGRKDDTLDSMKVRMGIFETETLPVIQNFDKLGKVITINADNTIENIQAELRRKLGL